MTRRILCAPDSFKESLSAIKVARAMAEGVRRAASRAVSGRMEPDECPVADGGEGSLDALITAMDGEIRSATVTGPLGDPITARYGIAVRRKSAESGSAISGPAVGIVELAEASGLAIIPNDKRDPTKTTTYGTGELIRLAVEAGCEEVIVCIGGSGTVDGGSGIAQALGAQYFDARGRVIEQPMTGGMLSDIDRIEPVGRASLPAIRIACDVTNPLTGPSGAAAVYGPQKGATPEQVKLLDDNLAHFAMLCGADLNTPGFGAAGGAAVGMVALCGAKLERGIDLILDAVNFDERCGNVTMVLTGEGRLDAQSLHGKATIGVAARAAKLGVPTIAIVGSTGDGADACSDPARGGFLKSSISLTDRFGRDRAMSDTAELIAQVTAEVIAKTEPRP